MVTFYNSPVNFALFWGRAFTELGEMLKFYGGRSQNCVRRNKYLYDNEKKESSKEQRDEASRKEH